MEKFKFARFKLLCFPIEFSYILLDKYSTQIVPESTKGVLNENWNFWIENPLFFTLFSTDIEWYPYNVLLCKSDWVTF